MIPYFEKTLCSVVHEIRYIYIFFSFCLTNYLTAIFTEFVWYYCYCCCYSTLRSPAIVKSKIINSLKPSLMQTWCIFNMFLVLCIWSLRTKIFKVKKYVFKIFIIRWSMLKQSKLRPYSRIFWQKNNKKRKERKKEKYRKRIPSTKWRSKNI